MSNASDRARCHACAHPERGRIDVAISRGVGGDTIARQFSLSRDSVFRHARNHLPPVVLDRLKGEALTGIIGKVDLESLRQREGSSLLGNLIAVRVKLQSLCDVADASRDYKASASIQTRILDVLKTTADLLGQFSASHATTVNNLVIDPNYLRLRVKLIDALRDEPNARRKVAAALREIESVTESESVIEGTGDAESGARPVALSPDAPSVPDIAE